MTVETGGLQNEFFNAARRDRALVSVYLANGKKLVGRIKGFDKFTILLDGPFGEQIVFKHAISTVSLGRHGAQNEEGAARAEGHAHAADPHDGD